MHPLDRRLKEKTDRELDFKFLSLQSVFEDFVGEAYTDFAHLTPVANQHVAKRLAAHLVSSGLLESTPKE
jgi:hypothetical protein